MQYSHPRTRDLNKSTLDRRGFGYSYTSSTLSNRVVDVIPPTVTPHRSMSLRDKYTPSLTTSTPSSSPTTASSSPPPPTSPLTYNAYRTARDAIDIKVRSERDSDPFAHRSHPYSTSTNAIEHSRYGGRYSYVKGREQLYDESDYDDMASSSQPSSPTFHAYRGQSQPQTQQLHPRLGQQRSAHQRTLSSGSSSYSSTSPMPEHIVPQSHSHSQTYTHLHQPHHQSHQQQPMSTKPRVSPASIPVSFATRYDTLPYYYRPRREEEKQLSLHDLTEDEASPRKASVALLPSSRHTSVIQSSLPLPATSAVELEGPSNPPIDHEQEDEDDKDADDADDVLPKFTSPRRRVSFSTSSERSCSPENRVRSGYLPPGRSLVAALGPKPKRPAPTPTPAPSAPSESAMGKGSLPTPPLEDTPPPAQPPGLSHEIAEERKEERTEGEVHRRTRSRPTLLDLLSVPGPLRSPSPPVEKQGLGAGSQEGLAVQNDQETNRQENMLPTPELTPTEESPSGRVADVVVDAQAASEVCEREPSLPVASPRKESSLPPSSPIKESSLPPSSPMKESSFPPSSPIKDSSLPPSSPIKDSSPVPESFALSRVTTPKRSSTPMTMRESLPPSSPSTEHDEAMVDVQPSLRTPSVLSSRAPSVHLSSRAPSILAIARAPSVHPISRASSAHPTSRATSLHLTSRASSLHPSLVEDDDVDIKYDPTENDLLSSPLSPAPSSPTPSSATAVPDEHDQDDDTVLPAFVAPEAKMERKRSMPVEDEPRPAKKAKRSYSLVSRTPSPTPIPEHDDEDDEIEVFSPRRRKPRSSGGRSKTKRKPRTSEFVFSEDDDEETLPVLLEEKPAAEEKKRKASTPPPVSEDEEDEQPQPPKNRGRKKPRMPSPSPTPSLAPSHAPSLAPEDVASKKKPRGRSKKLAKEEAIENVDWAQESPMSLVELEGMVIETLATSRATSMSCESLWRALMSGRPGLKSMIRHMRVATQAEDGPSEKIEERTMTKADWQQLLAHILTTGHALTGLFGRVDSSASDSDSPQSPNKPRRVTKLSFKAAVRAQWYYVPDRDTDKERATLIRSMMRGPGKRSETMKYKQYYWKPLGKITRWDREDDL